MSDKKHIDRIFQEGFKDFEANPSDAVWANIESKLNKKKQKRRVIPIWWRYAGVAALLLLLLTIGGVFFNASDENSSNQVVDTENTIPKNNNIDEIANPIKEQVKPNVVIADLDSQNDSDNSNDDSKIQSEIITDKLNSSKETSIAETSTSKSRNESKPNMVSTNKSNFNKNIVSPRNNNTIVNTSEAKNGTNNSQKALTNNISVANTSEENNKNVDVKNEQQLINKEEVKTRITEASKNNMAIANSNNEKIEDAAGADENKEENKLSITDALSNTKDVIEADKDRLENRWSVTPNAAPVYFNTIGEGSSIDPQFNGNSKTGEVNMSYGISASYALNKKITVRSGINRVNLGYNTNDVLVFQSTGLSSRNSALQNVSASSNGDTVSLISSETLSSDTSNSFASTNASINQALGYIEIPLEIQYTLSDKKFGINLIGGFSSFFLNNNEIFSEQENGTRTFLGEANNINDISYSANFGLGLNYKVTKKFDLNLEPIFKYQFNTFNNTSGNFSPFFIGVYTGLSIKF